MKRFHATSNGNVYFTAEEEAEWDAMEAAYVPPTQTPVPTKEQLLVELQVLTAKIQSLE
jgi:hypothetical protein